jgi:hypothetical protein
VAERSGCLGYQRLEECGGLHQVLRRIQQAALEQEPSYRVKRALTDGVLGQRLRQFADHITATAGEESSERVRNWF